ncbi:hypothetical protein CPJCM30710_14730 [Clostridium polyendosporum]|uniref:Polymerase beta nucleotidyltransferase domain-containing protein n=1 Tax=Clostridium polyendosporum TaxID=69208 RepID=A0A919RYX7_9CLOT|nr:nucleotidyltransferase domain-containing protein [Clostridium polyendosporum]GIM28807.1 hypothetical protein CPJCM30710_14730 [Clostridium polyendosporum]
MNNSQLLILGKLKSDEFIKFIEGLKVNTVLIFGSTITDVFNEDSDVDIAVLSSEKLKLNDILNLELFLEEMLNRPIDVVDLNSTNLDLFVKITILNTAKVVYTNDNNKSLEEMIDRVEINYRENENFFYYRRLDLLS